MPTLITPPATEPWTVADLKVRLGISDASQDALLGVLIASARRKLETWLNRAFITQEWEQAIDPTALAPWFLLPLKVQSLQSVTYVDAAGAQQQVDVADFVFLADTGCITSAAQVPWVGARSVVVRFKAGYGDAAVSVPEDLREAVALQVQSQRFRTVRDPGLTVDTVFGVSSQTFSSTGGTSLTDEVRDLASPYRVFA